MHFDEQWKHVHHGTEKIELSGSTKLVFLDRLNFDKMCGISTIVQLVIGLEVPEVLLKLGLCTSRAGPLFLDLSSVENGCLTNFAWGSTFPRLELGPLWSISLLS